MYKLSFYVIFGAKEFCFLSLFFFTNTTLTKSQKILSKFAHLLSPKRGKRHSPANKLVTIEF